MLAEDDVYIKEASKTIFELCADLEIKKRCWEREEFEDYAERLADAEAKLEAAEAALADREAVIADRESVIAEDKATIAEKDLQLQQVLKWAMEHGYSDNY